MSLQYFLATSLRHGICQLTAIVAFAQDARSPRINWTLIGTGRRTSERFLENVATCQFTRNSGGAQKKKKIFSGLLFIAVEVREIPPRPFSCQSGDNFILDTLAKKAFSCRAEVSNGHRSRFSWTGTAVATRRPECSRRGGFRGVSSGSPLPRELQI